MSADRETARHLVQQAAGQTNVPTRDRKLDMTDTTPARSAERPGVIVDGDHHILAETRVMGGPDAKAAYVTVVFDSAIADVVDDEVGLACAEITHILGRPVRYVPGWARDQELDPDDDDFDVDLREDDVPDAFDSDLLRLAREVGVERQRRHYARPDEPYFVTSVRPDPDLFPEPEPATTAMRETVNYRNLTRDTWHHVTRDIDPTDHRSWIRRLEVRIGLPAGGVFMVDIEEDSTRPGNVVADIDDGGALGDLTPGDLERISLALPRVAGVLRQIRGEAQ